MKVKNPMYSWLEWGHGRLPKTGSPVTSADVEVFPTKETHGMVVRTHGGLCSPTFQRGEALSLTLPVY